MACVLAGPSEPAGIRTSRYFLSGQLLQPTINHFMTAPCVLVMTTPVRLLRSILLRQPVMARPAPRHRDCCCHRHRDYCCLTVALRGGAASGPGFNVALLPQYPILVHSRLEWGGLAFPAWRPETHDEQQRISKCRDFLHPKQQGPWRFL